MVFFFRFNISWLKGDLKDQAIIDSREDLSPREREYLKKFYENCSRENQLPKKPSSKDFSTLQAAYGKKYSIILLFALYKYHSAGYFCMVQIFVFFICEPCIRK